MFLPVGLEVGVVRVDEGGDVLIGEAVAVDEVGVHPLHVVDAFLQLRLRSRVKLQPMNRPEPSSPCDAFSVSGQFTSSLSSGSCYLPLLWKQWR